MTVFFLTYKEQLIFKMFNFIQNYICLVLTFFVLEAWSSIYIHRGLCGISLKQQCLSIGKPILVGAMVELGVKIKTRKVPHLPIPAPAMLDSL